MHWFPACDLRENHYGFLQGYSAGHFDSLAIDPAAVIRQERGNRAANIIGKTHPPQGGLRGDEIIDLLVVAHGPAPKISFNRARRNRIDGDSARAQFFGHIACQYFDAAFHRGISRVSGERKARQS